MKLNKIGCVRNTELRSRNQCCRGKAINIFAECECVCSLSTYRGEERRIQGFVGETLGEKDRLEDPGVDENITLRWIFRKLDGRYVLD